MVLYCRCMIVLSISFVSFRYVTLRWFLSICSFLRFRISLARSLIDSFVRSRTYFFSWLACPLVLLAHGSLPSIPKKDFLLRSVFTFPAREEEECRSQSRGSALPLTLRLSLSSSPLARFLASTLLHGEREHFDFDFTIYLDIYGCSLVSFIQPALPMSWP